MPATRSQAKKRNAPNVVGTDGDAKPEKKSKVQRSKKATSSSSSEQVDDLNDKPWFTIFTKGDLEYDTYMSTEWGYEKRGDVPLFEKLSLEGAQSGLSWLTILRKRDAYRKVFYDFDPVRVAAMTDADVERIVAMDNGSRDTVVRHAGKIKAVINNAKCVLKLREENPDTDQPFDKFLWSFVNDKPIVNRQSTPRTSSPESEAMSKTLKKRGFKFVGPTTCYAFMQSVGMIIDHPIGSPHWQAAYERLKVRAGGYQETTQVG